MRRLTAVSLLVLAAATAAAAAPPGPAWREREDRVYGWRFHYPASMQFVRFQGFNRISWYGVSIANYPANGPSTWPLEAPTLPPDGVLVRLWHQVVARHHPRPRDDRLPLSLGRLPRYPVGPLPRPRFRSFQLGGTELRVAVWTGPRASRRDLAAVKAILHRFRPAALATGGETRPCGFFVLDRIGRYGRGTARRYDAGDLPASDCVAVRPFYLVRTKTTLSAVGWPRDSRGYKDCGVRFDARRREFGCANGARWDRFGRVLRVPRGWRGKEDPLARYAVTVGYDGHLLVSPGSYRYP